MSDPRPNWDKWALGLADAISKRADCTRRRVGAVILNEDNHVVGSGYNGAPSGSPGCLSAGACPRGQHFLVLNTTGGSCNCGSSWPCDDYVQPGTSYDTGKGTCISIHAEANALLHTTTSVKGCRLYVTDEPCDGCLRLIKGAGILSVLWPAGRYDF